MKPSRNFRLLTTLLPVLLLLSLLPSWGDVPDSGVSPEDKAAIAPVNPSASPEARRLLQYLTGLSGQGIISGQHDYLESPDEFNNKLKSASGKYALLHGYELGALNHQSAEKIAMQRQSVVNSAIKWYEGGGIVAMTFHQNLPGTPPVWSNVSMKLSQEQFNAYVTPGTPQYNSLIAELDDISGYLGELRDAGVPVLWRPYHEMNGDWFWWGDKSNFATLWNLVYDRFTHIHKLNNLLWVWNPNAPGPTAGPYREYYPGPGTVDVLAADIYNNDYQQAYYDDLLKLAGSKPIGIGESGELPDPKILSKTQSRWVYMMTWGKMLTGNNSTGQIQSFMGSPYTVSRDDYIRTVGVASLSEKLTATNGLNGAYFNNAELMGKPVLIRQDSVIDFNWHGGSPAAGIGADTFSVRWKGKIKPPSSGDYTFLVSADDGVRLWVGGKLIIDSWENRSGMDRTGSMKLRKDILYDIKVEYYENRGDASISLKWAGPHLKEAVVPQNALFLP
ncbi:glycosyl hydrolase [Paenibacillus sp. NPDC057934]|uniref:glycosyl hydrolase n=1 Tax=Paenibacillus sp. NPDC057934 TaxID=3346282 RepID=UPI0036DE2832